MPAKAQPAAPAAESAYPAIESFIEKATAADVEALLQPIKESLGSMKGPKAELAKKIDAVNSCGPITTTDNGVKTTIDIQAAANDTYGEFGVQMQAKVTLESDQLPQPVELNLYGLMFRIGTVGVSITGFDGLDDSTLKVTPVDTDALVAQAQSMESAVKNLGGG